MPTVQPLLLRVDRPRRPHEEDPPSAAALLNVSSKTAWRLLDRGELARVKIGARTFTTRESVDAFIARGGAPSLKRSDD